MKFYVFLCFILFGMVLSFTDVDNLCETKVHTLFVKQRKNLKNVTKYIISTPPYNQGLRLETCVSSSCRTGVEFPYGYEGVCVQKYKTVYLLAIDPETEWEPSPDTFKVPSCCMCGIRRIRPEN